MGFQLWDRLSALFRQANIYRGDNLFTDQTRLDRIISGNELLDFSKQHAILEQTNLQINRLERYKDFDMMDEVGEVSMGLDMYCLSGDTRIPLLDSTNPTIKELAESKRDEYWLYSFDTERGEYVPGRAFGAHISGRNADLVEVEFDDGLKLRVTANHKFLSREGYVKAADLKPGQSIIPLYKTSSLPESEARETRRRGFDQRAMARKGYEFIRMVSGIWKPTHQWVYETVFGERKGIIHHEDLTKRNNDPTNLKLETWAEHQRIHMALGRNLPPEVMEAKRKKCSERVKAKWQDPGYRLKLRKHCQEMMQLMHRRGLAFRRKEEYSKVNWEVLEKYVRDGGSLRDIKTIARSLHCAIRVIHRLLERHGLNLEMLRTSVGNHKVIAVRPCGVAAEVYDLYVEKHHCFAAGDDRSWVIVHNSDESTETDSERKHVVMVKAKSKVVKEAVEEFLYQTVGIDSQARPSMRYLCKYGDLPLEIVPTKDRDAVASLRFMNVYNFTRVETKHGDLVGFFFQDELISEPEFLHPWSVVHMRLTSYENIYHPYGRCCSSLTRILTPSGYVYLKDLKKDDKVYVFDGLKLVESAVVAACLSGQKRLLRIKTCHYANEATENHPILIRTWKKAPFKFGEKWFASLEYKRADEIKVGDELVIPKVIFAAKKIPVPQATAVASELIHERECGGRTFLGVKSYTRCNVPEFVDSTFAQFFGFLVGDGWLTRHGFSFALGEDASNNEKYTNIARGFGLNPRPYKGKTSQSKLPIDCINIGSKVFGRILRDMGLLSGAKKKRIPQWVYQADREIQIAFLEGLVDADGSTFTDEWNCERFQIELANEELIKDVKMLIHQIGWKCGHVSERDRGEAVSFHGKTYRRSKSWMLYFYKSDVFTLPGQNFGYGPNGRRSEHEKFGTDTLFEPVVSVDDIGIHETADIQVDHPASNFVADGIVVHNSILDPARKGFKQLRLMEDAALIYRITRAPERRVFHIPVGNIPTKEVYQYLEAISKQFKKRKIFNPATGEVDERWSPLIQEDDYWLPTRPDGGGPEVTTLPGGQNLDQIADIVYFKKKVLSAMKIPFAKVGLSEGTGEEAMKRASHISPEFATAVQWVQREYLAGLKKAVIVHLALKGFRVQDLKDFDLFMTASSAIDELYRIETWKSRSQVIGELKDTGLFPDKWIIRNFTDLTDEEIDELDEEKKAAGPSPEEAAAAGGEAGPELPVPEGFDVNAEKQVLMEQEGFIKRPATGLGTRYKNNPGVPQFEKLLNSNEFDGLVGKSQTIKSNLSAEVITEAKNNAPPPPALNKKKPTQSLSSSEPTEADLPSPSES